MGPLLSIRNLETHFFSAGKVIRAIDGISFDIQEGEVFGVVGETGCGKSVTALSILRLIPFPPGKIVEGEIRFKGKNLLELPLDQMRAYRGKEISMIFQEPMTSLNPVFRIGEQMCEVIRLHQGLSKGKALEAAVAMLERVRMPDARKVASQYPHQLSGGMRQRVMIAMELSCRPALLIADEPTTALDVTIQAQILRLLKEMQAEMGTSILLITHDLGVVAEMCDRVAVMYAGSIVEQAEAVEIFENPKHPYTQGLWGAILNQEKESLAVIRGTVPDLTPPAAANHPACPCFRPRRRGRRYRDFTHSPCRLLPLRRGVYAMTAALLEVKHLKKHFAVTRGRAREKVFVRAVDGVDFTIARGETLGLVGESGCGKTTVGRLIIRLIGPTEVRSYSKRDLAPGQEDTTRFAPVFRSSSGPLPPDT
jgi:oligopeptide/dipeptide ABC transporter ATP-binding protein